jgi:hypothetical protein
MLNHVLRIVIIYLIETKILIWLPDQLPTDSGQIGQPAEIRSRPGAPLREI